MKQILKSYGKDIWQGIIDGLGVSLALALVFGLTAIFIVILGRSV